MIKFFRHIRRNLMETGKTGKYFKYAIGEIILVVIGILIALQVNNVNETRKSNLELGKINQNLIQELESNQKALNSAMRQVKQAKDGSLVILSMIGSDENQLQEKDVDSLIEISVFFANMETH